MSNDEVFKKRTYRTHEIFNYIKNPGKPENLTGLPGFFTYIILLAGISYESLTNYSSFLYSRMSPG